jgi:hypothetical protein
VVQYFSPYIYMLAFLQLKYLAAVPLELGNAVTEAVIGIAERSCRAAKYLYCFEDVGSIIRIHREIS